MLVQSAISIPLNPMLQTLSAKKVPMFRTLVQARNTYASSLPSRVVASSRFPSVVDQLPTEVLLLIFSMLDFTDANVLQASTGRWPLTRVCRRWRAIVVDYPAFWSRITANFDSVTPKTRADLRALLSTHINRSKDHPLSVQIRWRNLDLDLSNVSEEMYEGLRVLLATSHRWTSAAFDLHILMLKEMTPFIFGEIPLLESLRLKVNMSGGSLTVARQIEMMALEIPTDAFEVAPKLRHFSVEGFLDPVEELRLPWDQLTYLSTTHANPLLNLDCLRLSNLNLMECSLYSSGEWDDDFSVDPSRLVVLPNLKKLILYGNAGMVLHFLYAPNLEMLHVGNIAGRASSDLMDAVQCFVLNHGGRSESPLQSNLRSGTEFLGLSSSIILDPRPILKLKNLSLECDPLDHRIAETLYLTRGVERLRLKLVVPDLGRNLFEDLMKWMEFREGVEREKYLLPKLEELTMVIRQRRSGLGYLRGVEGANANGDGGRFVEVAIKRMVDSRRRMSRRDNLVRLERLRLDVRDEASTGVGL
ncbi:hypothetical protein GYMLUDRAFT_71221 [Collybiopsis luxurians FD-317 M1]|nr:hypothetical protein GYMLUDRAFT_71221 [Collybiopsis luxurians FD-317 M1]